MPQSLTQKAVNNFVKGLITEAAELTFPDGASVDELNCELRRDGTRRRRLAVAFEDSAEYHLTATEDRLIHTDVWTNVAGDANREFIVVQSGNILFFYDKGTLPLSSNFLGDYIYEKITMSTSGLYKCQFASINGDLIVSAPDMDTLVVRYDPASTWFSNFPISFKVRDFEWQGAKSDYLEATTTPPTASEAARIYDTLNSGWADKNTTSTATSSALSIWTNENSGNYPPLTHPWFSGKDEFDNFSVSKWKKIGGGTSVSGNGRYVLDFFNMDRDQIVIDETSITPTTSLNSTETSRFRCVESFAGRLFYAGLNSADNAGTVLFSPLVDNINDYGACYQKNDPTSEFLSDLLDTDGGMIRIPDAVNIQKLYAFQNSIFVFAENGVWQITGVDGVFRATSFSLARVSRVGIHNPESFVAAEGIPFWWSRHGIHTLSYDAATGQAREQSLSIQTIQTFWDGIDQSAKNKVTGVYDNINKRIFWAYPNNDETAFSKLNNFLILDIPLQAFYPWKVSDQASNTNSVVGLFFDEGFGTKDLTYNVVDSSSNNIVDSSGNNVIATIESSFSTDAPAIVLVLRNGSTGGLTFGGFTSDSFLDWGDTDYSSYAVTGYDFLGDLVLQKNAPYVVSYCRLTEEGFSGNEIDGYEPVRPSSLRISVAWDFNENFGQSQQVYRLKYPVVVDPENLSVYDYPEDVVTSRLKVRGRGRSMRIKYESETGKDFILLGWGMIVGANPRF